jgi:hypothetical protein
MKTKSTFLLCFLLILPTLIFAQEEKGNGYLFKDFEKGKVFYKTGGSTQGQFNYNILNEKILFLSDNSTVLELANVDDVAIVQINGRTFDHIRDGLLYEKIKTGDTDLYVRWNAKTVQDGKTGAYGQKSNTSSISNVSQITDNGALIQLRVEDQFTLKPNNSYYLKIDKKFKRFSSVDSFAKLFKGHEAEIKDYAKIEKINFNNVDDLKKLVAYSAQFMK